MAVNKTLIMLQTYIITFFLLDCASISIDEEIGWITIPCQAKMEQGVKYRKITWYKVEEGSEVLTGLVLKDLYKNITVLYKYADHTYGVGENNSLLLPNTAGEICGIYRCTLWPPLGHYIQEGNSELYSADCIESQWKVQSSRKEEVPVKNHLKYFAAPCALLFCAVVIFILNLKMTIKTKEKDVKETLVPTDENL